jgi:hypothetical protein
MPDEPEELQPTEESAAAPEVEEVVTPSDALEQAEFEDDLALNAPDDEDEDTDEERETPAAGEPPAEAVPEPTLEDLVKGNPKLAAELSALTEQRAQTAANQRLQQQQEQAAYQNLQAGMKAAQAAYQQDLASRPGIEQQLHDYGETDVIAAQQLRQQWHDYWANQDAGWQSAQAYYGRELQTYQAVARTKASAEAAAMRAFQRFHDSDMPPAVRKDLSDKSYPGTFDDGMYQHLKEWWKAAEAHGRQMEKDETAARTKARREERAVNAQRGLVDAQNTPMIQSGGGGGRGRIPSAQEVDNWPLEKRLEELKKNPRLYDQVAMASANGRRR